MHAQSVREFRLTAVPKAALKLQDGLLRRNFMAEARHGNTKNPDGDKCKDRDSFVHDIIRPNFQGKSGGQVVPALT